MAAKAEDAVKVLITVAGKIEDKQFHQCRPQRKTRFFGGEPESEFNRIDLKSHYYGKPSKPVITPIVLGQ